MTSPRHKKRENGKQCAQGLSDWINQQQLENPGLRWSDQAAWEQCLHRSEIDSLLNHFHCGSKHCQSNSWGITICPPEKRDWCDWQGLDVFNYIQSVGEDLTLLRRYLNADARRGGLILDEDFDRRITAMREKLDGSQDAQISEIR